jgi:hypothetical protein
VRIGHLEDLDELTEVISRLQVQPGVAVLSAPAAKKKLDPPVTSLTDDGAAQTRWGGSCTAAPGAALQLPPQQEAVPDTARMPTVELTAENAAAVWDRALSRLSGITVDQARQFDSVAIPAPNRLVIRFKPGYAVFKSACERPEQIARFEQALAEVCGQPIRVEFALAEEQPAASGAVVAPARAVPPHQRLLEAMKHPLVHRAGELFGAQPIRVDDPPAGE